jgi:predicted transposase YbfD/YdcC
VLTLRQEFAVATRPLDSVEVGETWALDACSASEVLCLSMEDADSEDASVAVDAHAEAAFIASLAHLQTALWLVVDPRHRRGVRHSLSSILTIAILGCICGCDDAEALEDWGRKEKDWLAAFVPLPHGTPSQDVFLRVFAAIDPKHFRTAFQTWARALFQSMGALGQVAIDGQTHRGSHDRKSGGKPVHTVNALACGSGVVLAQQPTETKSNEIKAIPLLLELLYIKGALVSIDAMGCQVAIAKQILQRGGDYLFGLKGNQSTLHDEVATLFDAVLDTGKRPQDAAPLPTVLRAKNSDGGHGRIDTREAVVCYDSANWVPARRRWQKLTSLICICSTREDLTNGKTTNERRFYISSRRLSAEQALQATRDHWQIENGLHRVLDVTFGQDANRTRNENAPVNFNVMRNFALNALRAYDGDRLSVPRRRRLCDYRLEYREGVLAAMPTR